MKKKIYVAWFAYEDLESKSVVSDTIRSRAFTDESSMVKWIRKNSILTLKECGISHEEYNDDEMCKVAIHWDYKIQTITI